MRLAQGHFVPITEARRRFRSPFTKCLRSVLGCLGLCIMPWIPAFCQNTFFQFPIDQDALSGAPDFSFLNRPLRSLDQLVVRDGHLCRAGVTTAQRSNAKARARAAVAPAFSGCDRVRLFGVNLAFGANFPTQSDAPRIARRLRKLGVNLVRLHHMDSQPDANTANAGSILTTGPYPTLNPVSVARLRAFLDALKAEGIYVDLNLHVGYTFRPDVDQVPRVSNTVAMPGQSKPLHMFYPRMVQLQSEFACNLMEALALQDDPVLGLVEIDNETSLLHAWQTGGLDTYLVGEYQLEFQSQWNRFLKNKYGTTDSLNATWGPGDSPGPELLSSDPQQWSLEIHSPAQATLETVPDTDPPAVKVAVARGGAPVILKQVGFSITTERPYLAQIEMRADLPDGASRSVYWDIKQDVSPWSTLKSKTVSISNQWRTYMMAITPAFSMDGIGRFGVSVENVEVPIYARNWTLQQAARRGLNDGETIEDGNVSLVGEDETAVLARANDYLLFLADRDADYLRTIQGAVRSAVGNLVPVAGTQMGYGGLLNLDSHSDLDYQDNHFYVDHYSFPHTQWDGRDWRIRDTSSAGSGLGAFKNMAAARQANRPYTVSEFNQPWPNTHAAEIDALLAAFGAFQDWDSIMHFAYSHGRNWDGGVPNGFNVNGDWTKFPNFGQAAWLFRSGAIQAGQQPVEISVAPDLRLRAGREKRNGNISGFLSEALGYDPATAFVHSVRIARQEDGPLHATKTVPAVSSPYDSDTGDLTYNPDKSLFLIHAPMAAGVFGFAGTENVTAGAIDVQLASSARGFASLLLTALDQQPLASSTHVLLSTPGYTLRTQPGSNPARTQRIVNYPSTSDWWTLEPEPAFPGKPSGDLNGGIGPVWMERVEAY
ncbi:MAG TPA: hypothetical protein VOA41_15175, partial [Candidatus Dormibacteraeota bacterium]|nr:hypothetical protein [Candidatus Dormibacteraeota bacterium]